MVSGDPDRSFGVTADLTNGAVATGVTVPFYDDPSLTSGTSYDYRIKATNTGRYSTPPPMAESMYDRRLQAQGLGGEIRVENRDEGSP